MNTLFRYRWRYEEIYEGTSINSCGITLQGSFFTECETLTITITMNEVKETRYFRNYKVWQDSITYATKVYKVTAEMPWFGKKGLCGQLQRAVVSISSNIAEGGPKPSDTEFAHFLDTVFGSAFEVEPQLKISNNVSYVNDELYQNY